MGTFTEDKAPRMVAVVVAYDDPEGVRACVASVRDALPPGGRLVVFDNGPDEAARKRVRDVVPEDVGYWTEGANLGYAGAGAHVLEHLFERGAEYVALLNQDLTVDRDAFEHLVAAAEADPTVGVTGGMTLDRDDPEKVVSSGGALRWPWCIDADALGPDDPHLVVTGALFLVTRRAYEHGVNFDPDYFLYFEETDFCHRTRQAGLRVVLTPARAYHEGGVRGIHYAYWMTRNRIRFFRKHGQARYLPGFLLYLFGFSIPALAWTYRRTPLHAIRNHLKGVWWNVQDARRNGFWLRGTR